MLYVSYITTTPYRPCNKNNIARKGLYDFYYTLVTLTTVLIQSLRFGRKGRDPAKEIAEWNKLKKFIGKPQKGKYSLVV